MLEAFEGGYYCIHAKRSQHSTDRKESDIEMNFWRDDGILTPIRRSVSTVNQQTFWALYQDSRNVPNTSEND